MVNGVQTILNLLTRDGVVYLAFSPSLTAEQYAELLELTKRQSTREEMLAAVGQWAQEQGLKLGVEE
jgi:hypothetical protein